MNPGFTPQLPRPPRLARISPTAWVGLLLLLIPPILALSRLAAGIDWRILVGAPLALSVLMFLAYRSDKRRAEGGAQRIPEAMLHLGEFIGGWPGAFLGQRRFRHKTAKISYQITFWVIVAVHQYVALDSLVGWRLAKGAARLLTSRAS